jgi:nucleotide-binding universal stress UspA family protein
VQLIQALDAAEALQQAVTSQRADALVVGRAAPGAAGVRIVRLGRVARRLLRSATMPLVVVPPDVTTDALGDGPLVALVRLDARSARTATFAAALAGRLGRPLALIHVIPPTLEQAAPFFPADLGEKVASEQRARGEEALARWVAGSGLAPQLTAVLPGNPIDAALAFADARRAPLLLVGARPLHGIASVLAAGTASVLAAVAALPVVVVPSPE